MNVALPAPGGKVGLKTFTVYIAGAAGGVAVMANYGIAALPEAAYNWNLGPVSGLHVWFGVGAILGAGLAAMAAAK